MLIDLWKYRGLIVRNSFNDLRNRYSGSAAGYLWNVFVPLAQIVVFSVIFGVLLGSSLPHRPEMREGFQFVVFLCAGLLPWNAFADTLNRGVTSLVGNAGYLKKLPIPEEIFVAQDACSGFFSALLALGLFLVFSILIAGYGPYATWLQVIPGMLLLSGFAFGLGLFLSCINVFIRDIQPLMSVVLLLWFWLTPVAYMVESFADSRHAWLLKVFALNPAYYYIHLFHEAIYQNRWATLENWLACGAITGGMMGIAWLTVRRLRVEIRDVL